LRSEIAGLPSAPGLYDPQQRLAPALQKLGVELAAIANLAQLSEFRGPVAIIVPISDELSTAQRLAARGTGIVWVAAEAPDPPAALVHCGAPLDAGFAESAAAQFLFGQALRQALRNKQAHAATSSTSAPQSNPGPP
jgi:hypothetical protein